MGGCSYRGFQAARRRLPHSASASLGSRPAPWPQATGSWSQPGETCALEHPCLIGVLLGRRTPDMVHQMGQDCASQNIGRGSPSIQHHRRAFLGDHDGGRVAVDVGGHYRCVDHPQPIHPAHPQLPASRTLAASRASSSTTAWPGMVSWSMSGRAPGSHPVRSGGPTEYRHDRGAAVHPPDELPLRQVAGQAGRIATARVHPAEPRCSLTGKAETRNPLGGSASRLCIFSIWQ